MQRKHFRVVSGDRGGWNAIEPIVHRATKEGHKVAVYFVGSCAKQLEEGKLLLPNNIPVITDHTCDVDSVKSFVSVPHHLTITTGSGRECAPAASSAINYSQPPRSILVEDYYGSAQLVLKGVNVHRLSSLRVCTLDTFAAKIVRDQFPDLPSEYVFAHGNPYFDTVRVFREGWEERRQVLRRALEVKDKDIVALIAGQLGGTAESLLLFTEALQQVARLNSACVILRPHIRAKWPDAPLLARCQAALPPGFFKELGGGLVRTSEDYLPGVDFVLSGYSTTNHFAILCNMPGVVYVGTPTHKYYLAAEQKAEGPIETARPLQVKHGAAWYVERPEELVDIMHKVWARDVEHFQAARRPFLEFNDGFATARVYDQVMQSTEGW